METLDVECFCKECGNYFKAASYRFKLCEECKVTKAELAKHPTSRQLNKFNRLLKNLDKQLKSGLYDGSLSR